LQQIRSSESTKYNCKKCGLLRYSKKHECITELSSKVNENLYTLDREVGKKLREYRLGPQKQV